MIAARPTTTARPGPSDGCDGLNRAGREDWIARERLYEER
jgi:hypothetical protein